MKSIFITFDQAYYDDIIEVLTRNNARGFTAWQEVQGRGSKTGDPHYGSHAWPSIANAIMRERIVEKTYEIGELRLYRVLYN